MPRYLLVLFLSTLAPASTIERPEPGSAEGTVTSVVASLLEHQHLQGVRLDDAASAKWLDKYLNSLDPMHLYFLQSDIDQFRIWEFQLDDNLHRANASDLAPAFEIFGVFVDRVKDRSAFAIHIANDPVDFTLDESFDLERTDLPWPADPAEADDLWRRYVKEQLLRGELWDRERDKHIAKVVERFEDQVKGVDEMESFDVLEYYLSALSEIHDPHSAYFKPASRDNFNIDLSNSVEGIGAVLRRENEFTRIERLVPGGPAALSKQLQEGDKIVAVAQGDGEAVDIIDTRIDKVVKLIRGKKGSEVRLTVVPEGAPTSTTKVVKIVRDRVQLEDSMATTKIRTIPGTDEKVAVVNVPAFYAPTGGGGVSRVSADVRSQIESLAEPVDAVVIDLRYNSGGSLAEAIDLTGLFIDKGPVVQVKGRRGEVEIYRDRDGGVVWDGPLVVLTSPFSASASEIFAGAIQDYGRGLIVGSQKTHGKGTVQTVVPLDNLLSGLVPGIEESGAGMLKLTTQQFYRVNGASTQDRGIGADIRLPTPYEDVHEYEAEIPGRLEWDQVEPASIKRAGDLSRVIPELGARSAKRVAANPDLQTIAKANAWQRDEKAKGGVISLNLEERQREAKELEELLGTSQEDEEDEGGESADEPKKDEKDPRLDEALNITADFIELLGAK